MPIEIQFARHELNPKTTRGNESLFLQDKNFQTKITIINNFKNKSGHQNEE